ncbi:unnamed protein product [Malus baccata var. baccata]
MAVGEIFLAAFLEVLLHRLVPREILTNFGHLRGAGKKLGKWRGMLYGIAFVLNDAEEKQLTNNDMVQWLDDLEDLAYDVDDVLDKFSTEMLRWKAKEQTRSRTRSMVRGLIPKFKFKFNVRVEVEETTHRLQEISERKDMLGLKYIGTPMPVIGRDDDKAKIIEFLSKDEPSSVNFDVIAIVGMPGVMKTTLSQLVLNKNTDAQKEFNPEVWVSVSDEFDLLRITKAIIESVTAEPCQLEEFNSILERLSKVLVNKKLLLILDDVWNTCDYELWERLRSPFRAEAPGSKIIVTTRDAKVARTMGATEVHDLQCISNDDCWKVFVQHGSLSLNNVVAPDFRFLREKIVARCNGLPLRCFAYCSILPKDYEFGEMQLILLWMVEGLLQVPGERKEMEDIGADYFGDKDNSTYVMHDLVGDLASSVLGEIYFRLEDKLDHRCSPKTRHSSYILGKHDGVIKFEAFKEATHLPTFLPLTLSKDLFNFLTWVTLDLLPRMEYLWVLSLNGYRIMQLPNSIGKVKHLQYLDLTHTEITSLPESISTLHNLQTLILDHCSLMPTELGRLTNLQTLQTFVVGKESGLGISEIMGVLHLRGTLHLLRLENVLDVQDAMKANFVNKDGLDEFVLEWSNKKEMKVDVLDSLQPHQNLQVLNIRRYGGLKFSPWVGDPLFTNMVVLRLEGWHQCQFLPPLGQLPSLKELSISGMSAVENVGIEFYGESNFPFPLLESLTFSVMLNWKEWSPCKHDQTKAFPCLNRLCITNCPKLEGSLPENLDLLSKLVIYGCEQLVASIASYQEFCELISRISKFGQCTSFVYFARHQIRPKLRRISITSCKNLKSLIEEEEVEGSSFSSPSFMHEETSCLQDLVMINCPYVASLSFRGHLPRSLKRLLIRGSKQVESVADTFNDNTCLEDINLKGCSNLKSLPDGFACATLLIFKGYGFKTVEIMFLGGRHSSSSRGFATALRVLSIDGEDPDVVSFPLEKFPEMLLPKSLIELHISNLPNLMKLGAGIQLLTSLVHLDIWGCPKLPSMEKEGMPVSVTQLSIDRSPMLKERCKPGIKGRYWPSIARIPFMHIGDWNSTRSPS